MNNNLFEITEDHLKLLKNFYVEWQNDCFGAPAIDPKRPYGNSSVDHDIAEILGWIPKNEEVYEELTDEQYEAALKLHSETETALQICLSNLKFEIGTFENKPYTNIWTKL